MMNAAARSVRVPGKSRAKSGEKVDARAFKALVKAAVARNGTPAKKR